MPELAHKRILVAIESDATRYHGEHASRPRLLNQSESEQILAHLSADLAAQFPQVKSCGLSLAGALFDQTQLLRPGYPVFARLRSLHAASFGEQEFQARLLSIGAESGRMPEPELQPSENIPLGLLQTLPVLVSGETGLISELSQEMEHRFLESGQLSAHSAKALEANFDITVNHARFMTLTDLNAMLRLQLEHFGFLPLWQLLDAAINTPSESVTVQGSGGQTFRWNGTSVRCEFETFDHWAGHGAGKPHSAQSLALAKGYSDWTREYRQYLATLSAHDIPVEQVLANVPDRVLEGSFLVEESAYRPRQGSAGVTEHSSGELGTVAVSVFQNSVQYNYYPLVPSGLNELHSHVRQQAGTAGGVSFPGSILYDERKRQLKPDIL